MIGRPARVKFMHWLVAGGAVVVESRPEDGPAMLQLLQKYRDRPMDLADASLVVLADRLGIAEVLTLDRADFDVYRLPGGRPFVQPL